ncbi:AraC family transcriptional regulator [Sphingosinicella sp. LHD-64]|uniref:helix-turn-helix domain-containing protein n=1 Tax=Sphingosinicella sp. LHD-64 TaxID=3072139 RepID=UPI00280C4A28|nr:AraC family transcriptional regulator [Sphingosinicella sp. LHD-64]MDQ8754653.1 AraC family transcriptional regulator [Sphingosinicella sp. LHD-64]
MAAQCPSCEGTPGTRDRLAVGAYLGQVARSATAPRCHLSAVAHVEARALPEHAHDWPFVSMLLKGSYVSRTRTREIEFGRSTAVYHPGAFQHRDEIGRDGATFLCLQLDPALLRDIDMPRGCDDDIATLDEDQAYLALGALYCALWTGADEFVFEALAAELAACLFSGDGDGRRAEPAWLKRVEGRLREEMRVPLADLAEDAGVHVTTLTRLFRRHRNCSIGEFRACARARRAFLEIVGDDAPLAEISLAAGYADQSHMTRDVAAIFGLSPGRIRSRA